MPQEIIPVTYTDANGQTQQTSVVRGKPMPRRIEVFCRHVAGGDHTPPEAYKLAYDKDNPMAAMNLMGRTEVILRIQQLRSPVIPKVAAKFEYSLNRAMEQAQIAWDLAFAKGDVGAMLKTIELQSKLTKLLAETIDVNHRYGFLDDASTDTLVNMKKQLEAVQKKRTIDITPKEESHE